MREWIKVWGVIAVGVGIRVGCLLTTELNSLLRSRVELSTGLTSPERLVEGVYLSQTPASLSTPSLGANYAPHSGSPVHTPPLLVYALSLLTSLFPSASVDVWHTWIVLAGVVADAVAAYALAWAAHSLRHHPTTTPTTPTTTPNPLSRESSNDDDDGGDRSANTDDGGEWTIRPHLAAAAYVLNPVGMASCLAGSLSGVSNAGLMVGLAGGVAGSSVVGALGLGLAIYLSVAPWALVFPLAMMVGKRSRTGTLGSVRCLAAVGGVVAGLAWASTWVTGGLSHWVWAVYGPMMDPAISLRPNVGLWWYFHTEMFPHFSTFFICVFHLFPLAFLSPLLLRFSSDPVFLYIVLSGIGTLFKPYPQMGDAAAYVASASLVAGLHVHMRYKLLNVNLAAFACAILPTFWFIWVEVEAGNANFFYNTTLVYAMAQIWFILDLVYARSHLGAALSPPTPDSIGVTVTVAE